MRYKGKVEDEATSAEEGRGATSAHLPRSWSLEVKPPHHLALEFGTVWRYQWSHCRVLPLSIFRRPSSTISFIVKRKLNLDTICCSTKLLLWYILGVFTLVVFLLFQVIRRRWGWYGDHPLVPITILLQSVQDVLCIWMNQIRPCLPQWMDNVVNEANLWVFCM